jgi:hypothetical protein
VRRDDHPRRTESALDGSGVDERLLHRMQATTTRQTLDRDDLTTVRLRRGDQARTDEITVQIHRARSALSLLACILRSGQAESLAQDEEQTLGRPDIFCA